MLQIFISRICFTERKDTILWKKVGEKIGTKILPYFPPTWENVKKEVEESVEKIVGLKEILDRE